MLGVRYVWSAENEGAEQDSVSRPVYKSRPGQESPVGAENCKQQWAQQIKRGWLRGNAMAPADRPLEAAAMGPLAPKQRGTRIRDC